MRIDHATKLCDRLNLTGTVGFATVDAPNCIDLKTFSDIGAGTPILFEMRVDVSFAGLISMFFEIIGSQTPYPSGSSLVGLARSPQLTVLDAVRGRRLGVVLPSQTIATSPFAYASGGTGSRYLGARMTFEAGTNLTQGAVTISQVAKFGRQTHVYPVGAEF